MCRGGGGANLLYLLCLISNTMPQLEQSSLQPSTDLQHRHLLQTTFYRPPATTISFYSTSSPEKENSSSNRLDGGGGGGGEKPEGPSALQPTTEDRAKLRYRHYYYFCILRDIALNYHPTKFGDNCKTQCWNMSKTINWRLRTCLQFKDGIRRQNKWK